MMVRFNMVGFVDDSTCITGVGKNATLADLLTKMKDDAQLWHDLLWCSGGKLELPKCGYHVVHFNFDASGIPRMQHSPGESITLNNEHGTEVIIKSKNIFQTRLNLGHSKSPAGNCNTEFERTMYKASVFYTHLRAHETGRNLLCRLLLEIKHSSLYCVLPVGSTHWLGT